jgi:hypothetical protein
MPDLTSQDLEDAATEALINGLKIKANQALQDDKFILAATACRMLEELSMDRAISTGSRDAWTPSALDRLDGQLHENTVAVPIIRPVMRAETPARPQPEFRCCIARLLVDNVSHGCSLERDHMGLHQYPTMHPESQVAAWIADELGIPPTPGPTMEA